MFTLKELYQVQENLICVLFLKIMVDQLFVFHQFQWISQIWLNNGQIILILYKLFILKTFTEGIANLNWKLTITAADDPYFWEDKDEDGNTKAIGWMGLDMTGGAGDESGDDDDSDDDEAYHVYIYYNFIEW